MAAEYPRVVLPGDSFLLPEAGDAPIKLGPGLRLMADSGAARAVVKTAGILQHKPPAVFWVDVASRHVGIPY